MSPEHILAVTTLWAATLWTTLAHLKQARYVRLHGSQGVSVIAELHNVGVAIMLWFYSFYLGDLPLLFARTIIVLAWIIRWAASKTMEDK